MNDDEEFLPEGEEVGPKKSFWAHLNDLRAALIRSAVAIGLALVVCLLLSPQLVKVLEYPLSQVDKFEQPKPTVTFRVGDNVLGPYVVTREQFPGLPPGDAPHAVYQVNVKPSGAEQVVTLKLLPPDPANSSSLGVRLHNFSPAEAFFIAFHVALYAALVVSSPFWLYFMGGFFLPALKVRERQLFFKWLGWSLTLFVTGVLLTYFVLLPLALRASVEYSSLLGFDALDWRANDYISFVAKFIFGMGLGFEFPVVVLLLVKLGVITHQQLKHYRRHVIVLCFILGALLTTPEPITQVAMAVPLCLLYEACIWISWYWERKKRRAGDVVDV